MTSKCIACGMPMLNPSDFANEDSSLDYCKHCARPDGSMKSQEEVLDGMTGFLVQTQGIDQQVAREMASQAMRKLPAWSGRR